MPDWFYRTIARPLLFCLPDPTARRVALGLLGTLGRLPAGGRVIDFLGHMRADPALAVTVGGQAYASPFLLGWRVDPEGRAAAALARFGIGGSERYGTNAPEVERKKDGLLETGATAASALHPGPACPVLTRARRADGTEFILAPDGLEWPVWPATAPPPPDLPDGVVLQVGDRSSDGGWCIPLRPPNGLAGRVHLWRQALGPERPLVVAGGVAEPADGVALLEAGADLVLIDAGLVFSGPGLIKRCNEAWLATRPPPAPRPTENTPAPRQSWFWAAALGAALFGGGLLALILALTRVLLPYDEHYLGLVAAELARLNPRLLAFMSHDRATLAGVMLGLGWLYWRLALAGIRRGDHAAWLAVVGSALVGFASFFYFLGFGYFDPLHAFVTAILFQLLVATLTGARPEAAPRPCVDQHEDATWRRAQWSQLLLVVHAFGLLFAGLLISFIGLTRVFVAEDLAFLCIGAGEVPALGERLIAVVAHDRATLGGMLLACGIASLLPVLWDYRRGNAWLRDALLGLGAPSYAAAIGIHHAVGYLDWRHLLPAWVGGFLFFGGLALGWRFLGGLPIANPASYPTPASTPPHAPPPPSGP